MAQFRLIKGRLLEISGEVNQHQFGMAARVSHPTIERYVSYPERVDYIDLRVLADALLVALTPEQVLNLRLGDIFTLDMEVPPRIKTQKPEV